jgi:hypothetical protein
MGLARLGVAALPVEAALDRAGRLASAGVAQRTLAAVDWRPFKEAHEARRARPLLERLGGPARGAEAPPPGPSRTGEEAAEWRRLRRLPAEERRRALVDLVRGAVCQVLGWTADDLPDTRQGLFTLGMDSLLAVQLRDRLEALAEQPVPAAALFDYPTIEGLAGYLDGLCAPAPPAAGPEEAGAVGDDLLDRIERLSEEEVDRLLGRQANGGR